jgi:hypothetical protein
MAVWNKEITWRLTLETKELIEWLRSCAEKNCPMCEDIESCVGPAWLLRKAAERLEELIEQKLD